MRYFVYKEKDRHTREHRYTLGPIEVSRKGVNFISMNNTAPLLRTEGGDSPERQCIMTYRYLQRLLKGPN